MSAPGCRCYEGYVCTMCCRACRLKIEFMDAPGCEVHGWRSALPAELQEPARKPGAVEASAGLRAIADALPGKSAEATRIAWDAAYRCARASGDRTVLAVLDFGALAMRALLERDPDRARSRRRRAELRRGVGTSDGHEHRLRHTWGCVLDADRVTCRIVLVDRIADGPELFADLPDREGRR
jgi:hypothetical protein